MSYFSNPFVPALNLLGSVAPAAKCYFYLTGTSTPATVYADADLTTPLSNPVVANINGRFPDIFLDDATTYRVRLETALGALIDEIDPFSSPLADLGNPDQGASLVAYRTNYTVKQKLSETVSVNEFGALGDGSSVDAALTAAIATGATQIVFTAGDYLVSQQHTIPTGVSLVGTGEANIIIDVTAFNSTNPALPYATNACPFLLENNTDGGFFNLTFAPSAYGAELAVMAIALRQCARTKVRDCEFSGFSKTKVVRIDSCTRVKVQRNVFRDMLLSSATTGQLTCVDIDDNRPAGGSLRCEISGNTFNNILASPAFIAAFGYQTDGINVSHESSSGHLISGNMIDTVGEGIDCFGEDCNISGNTVRSAYNYGVKLVHGARNNLVTANKISQPGLGGIGLGGNTADTNFTENNTITGNSISEVNIAGNWSAATSFGIKMEDDGTGIGSDKICRNNVIFGNEITRGTAMKIGILSADHSAGNTIRENLVTDFITSEFTAALPAQETFKSASPAKVIAALAADQSIPTATWTKILFVDSVDSRSEFASNSYTAKVPRVLSIAAQIRTGAANATKTWQLAAYVNGSEVRRGSLTAAGSELCLPLAFSLSVASGDVVSLHAFHNETGSVSITSAGFATFLTIAEAG